MDNANLNVPLTGNDDFIARFTGKLNVPSAGPIEFGLASNDGSAMFLDMDLGPGENWVKVSDNNRISTGAGNFQGFNATGDGTNNSIVPQIGPVNVPSAGTYDFIVGMFNLNANESGIELYWDKTQTANTPYSIIPAANLSTVAGDFYSAIASPVVNNAITVTANSTINVAATSATVGSVTVNPGVTLSKTGNDLTATNLTVSSPGTASLDVSGRMTAQTINMPATSTVRKTGSGDLVLSQVPATTLGAGTSLDVGAGRLVATSGAARDSLGDALVTLSGGTLAVQGDGTLPAIPTGPGLFGVTGKFYNTGLVFDQNLDVGRTDPAVFGWSAFGSVAAMDAALNPLTPAFNNVPINVPLNFPGDPNNLGDGGNDDEGGNIFAQSGIGVNLGPAETTNFVARFAGKLKVTQAGPTAYDVGANDGAVMFLDLDTGPGTNWAMVVVSA